MLPLTPPLWAVYQPLYAKRRFIRAECHPILQAYLPGPTDRTSGAKILCEHSTS
jgi:hypothetical protein